MTRRDPAVAVIGAGMSGLCVAIMLLRSGIGDVMIYEKADEVGHLAGEHPDFPISS
jgi:cation diffusion facilitator CzcD-associated flavoprotein CzcO